MAQREQTLRAVEQLRRETDLLRRLVRAYTATGDPLVSDPLCPYQPEQRGGPQRPLELELAAAT